jgi:alpha-glucosidase (family GH31 glycosyl hydrolase)
LFKEQYIELSTRVPRDASLYGTGEVSLPTGLQLPRDGTTITLWARDMPSANPYCNLYGSHPFYMQVDKGEALGVRGLEQRAWRRGEGGGASGGRSVRATVC